MKNYDNAEAFWAGLEQGAQYNFDNVTVRFGDTESSALYYYWRAGEQALYLFGHGELDIESGVRHKTVKLVPVQNNDEDEDDDEDDEDGDQQFQEEVTYKIEYEEGDKACAIVWQKMTVGVTTTATTAIVSPEGSNEANAGYIMIYYGEDDCTTPKTRLPDVVQRFMPRSVLGYSLAIKPDDQTHGWYTPLPGGIPADELGAGLQPGLNLLPIHGGDIHVFCRFEDPAVVNVRPPPFPFEQVQHVKDTFFVFTPFVVKDIQ